MKKGGITSILFLAMALAATRAGAGEGDPWKAHAELSYANAKGNTNTENLAAKVSGDYDDTPNRYYLKGSALFGKTDGAETSNRWYADGRYERAVTERLFWFLTASYLKDKFAGYDSRIEGGPGVGYEFLKTDSQSLKGFVAALYSYENFANGEEASNSYATGKAAGHYEWKINKNVHFKQLADYTVSLEDTNVYFFNSESDLNVKMVSNLSLGLSYIVNYQNSLPSPDAKHTDRIFLTSLVVDF